jgi:hypothetical protein
MLRRRTDYAAWTEWETVQDGMSLDWRISGQAQRARPQRRKPGH